MISGNNSKYMDLALKQAENALSLAEVPVGCVVLKDGVVVASTHNLTNLENDPLCHAEYIAIKQLTENIIISETNKQPLTFYITVEPCVMCHGVLSRVGAIVFFGCYNEVFGTRKLTGGFAGTCLFNQNCINILKRFYQQENMIAPENKRIVKTNKKQDQN